MKHLKSKLVLSLLILQLLLLFPAWNGIPFSGEGRNSANAAPVMLTGNVTISELVVDGTQRVVVIGSTLILTGNITVKDDGQLTVSQSRVQFSIRGEKAYNMSVSGRGRVDMVNSVMETLSGASRIAVSGNSSLTVTNSEILGFSQFSSTDNTVVTVQDTRMNIGYISSSGKSYSMVGASMIKVGKGSGSYSTLSVAAVEAKLEDFQGDVVTMNVNRSVLKGIQCNVLDVSSREAILLENSTAKECFVKSDQDVAVRESRFGSLTFLSSGTASNVNITVEGVAARAGGPIYSGQNVTVRRYWYLKVRATDFAGTGIPGRIIVMDYLGNLAATGQADADGTFFSALLAEIVNNTRMFFVGNYRIRAEYLSYKSETIPVALDGNKEIRVRFLESVPVESTTKITLSSIKIRVGDSVKVEGYINTNRVDEYVQIVAVGPGDVNVGHAVKTNKDGVFKGEVKLTVEGEWYIYADWLGGSYQGMSTKSQAYIVTVEPRPPVLVLLLRALPVVIVVLGLIIGLAFLALSRRKRIKI